MRKKLVLPTLNDIEETAKRIKPYCHITPVLTSEILNNLCNCTLFFKCENFQKSGAFKFRGAINALLNLSGISTEIPVITHSSGNHGGALAKAAKLLGRKCIVVMPENAPKVKIEAVKYYGASIVFCKPTLQSREDTTNKIIKEKGALLIHPFNDFNIICGQGTSAFEFLKIHPELEIIIAPVGGGGLLSGTSIAAKSLTPGIIVYGAEPREADDAYRSLNAGKIIPSENPSTIADGLLTSLGELTFAAISQHVNDIITVKEETIIQAMKLVFQYLKIVIEPSSAVALAIILENTGKFKGATIGIILSGGNVELAGLPFLNP